MHSLLTALRYVKGLWPYYVGIAFCSTLVALTGVAIPFVISQATALMVTAIEGGKADVNGALWLAVALFGFDSANAVLRNWGGFLGDVMASKLKAQMSTRYYEHLLDLPQKYYDNELTGTIISRLNRAITEISNFLNVFSNNFLQMIITTVITVVIVLEYSWELALLVIALYPLFLWLTALTSKKWQRYQTEKNLEVDIANGRFAEVVTQIRVVKSFVKESLEHRHFHRRYHRTIELTRHQSTYWHVMDTIRGIVLACVFFAIYAYIFTRTVAGHFTIPEMVLLVTLINALRAPLFSMSFIVDSFQRATSGSKDFVTAMKLRPEISDVFGAKPLEVSRGHVEFDAVSFAYTKKYPVLTDITFTARSGRKIALVGESGVGKTTLTNLLMRLYEPKSGMITIDNQDISKVTQESLRKNIAVVFQEPALFSGTIRENIAYAHPRASEAQVIEAAKIANAHEFISKLDKGYDSEIGERGIKLSGGQKQRIAIARATLKNAPILILDEATSSLDSKAEHLVQEALGRLMRGRTTIIIAHRLSTIAHVDTVITLKNGKIDEIGSPHELAKTDGIYAQLLKLQMGVSESAEKKLESYEIIG